MADIELRDALPLNGIDNTPGTFMLKGDFQSPADNDIRIIVSGINCVIQRYNETGTAWEDIFTAGGSITAPDALIIEKVGSADVVVDDAGQIRNLVRSASFTDGTVVADVFGETFLVCDGTLTKAAKDGPAAWRVVQSDDSTQSTGIEFEVSYTTPIDVDGSTGNLLKVRGVGLPAGVIVQAKFYENGEPDPVWQNVSDVQFASGEGAPLDEATGIITSDRNLFAPGSTPVRFEFKFSESVTLLGGNATADDIYTEVNATPVKFTGVITTEEFDSQLAGTSNTTPFNPTEDYHPATRKFVLDNVVASLNYKGGYDAANNVPDLDVSPSGVIIGDFYTITASGLFFTKQVEVGDAIIAEVDNATTESDWTVLNRNLDAITIKNLYESNLNTEGFETLEKLNLGILTGGGGTALHYHSADRARANHTGTQPASTISDFDAEVANNSAVAANTLKATIAQINNTTGYANYLDSSTSSSSRTYAIDTELLLVNDKTYPDGARYPDGTTSYWDTVNCKFTPDQAGGNYAFSVNFNVDPVERDKRLVVKFISYNAGGPGVDELIQERLVRLQKDTGEITPVSLSFTRGITSAIVTNGVSVTLEFQDTAAEVYDITCGLAKVGAAII